MRYKYPHIIDGALSSSGVVNAVEDLFKYDGQLYDSMKKSGQWCVDAVEKLVKYWDDLFYKDKVAFQLKKTEAAPQYKDDIDFFEIFTAPAGLV